MNNSIWDIDNNIQAIFNDIEENGGEITPEQEEQLIQNQEDFVNKVDSYCALIDKYNSYIDSCKTEKKRVNELQKTRDNIVTKLKSVLLFAVDKYGSTGKSGNKIFETATRKLFIKSIDKLIVDEERKQIFTNAFISYIIELQQNGVIEEVNDELLTTMIRVINAIIKAEYSKIGETYNEFTINDINCIDIEINIKTSFKDLFENNNIISLLDIRNNNTNTNITVETFVNKDDVKLITAHNKLEKNPIPITIAKFIKEQSLTIK